MTNLRDKKKEKTKEIIQITAFRLFEHSGYEKTTMSKIASEAEIGVGTLYNYYPSKVELLFSIIEGNLQSYIDELQEIINSKKPIKESLQEFFGIYLKSFHTYGKNVWKDLLREALFREENGYLKIKEIDRNFIDQLFKLLRDRLKIESEGKLAMISNTLYSLLAYNIIIYISDGTLTSQVMLSALMEQINLVLEGIPKCNAY